MSNFRKENNNNNNNPRSCFFRGKNNFIHCSGASLRFKSSKKICSYFCLCVQIIGSRALIRNSYIDYKLLWKKVFGGLFECKIDRVFWKYNKKFSLRAELIGIWTKTPTAWTNNQVLQQCSSLQAGSALNRTFSWNSRHCYISYL